MLDEFASRGVTCDPYVKGDHPKVATREWGDCTWDGSTFFVGLYSGNAQQTRQLVDAFKSAVSGYLLLGSNYAIVVDDYEKAKVLAERLDMEII